jgi:hypothetical protein
MTGKLTGLSLTTDRAVLREKNRPQHGGMLRPSFIGRHGTMASGSDLISYLSGKGSCAIHLLRNRADVPLPNGKPLTIAPRRRALYH